MPDDATSNPIGSRKLFLKIIERKDIRRLNIPAEIPKKSIPRSRFFRLKVIPLTQLYLELVAKKKKRCRSIPPDNLNHLNSFKQKDLKESLPYEAQRTESSRLRCRWIHRRPPRSESAGKWRRCRTRRRYQTPR